MMPGITPVVGQAGKPNLKQILDRLNLSTSAKLVLDAGDATSYPGGQTWVDLSGLGYSMLLGTTTSSESSDPTFNGTIGKLSASEYFTSDGGDYFTLNQANPTWVNNLHKDGSQWAALGWVLYPTLSDSSTLFGTQGSAGSSVGVRIRCEAAGHMNLHVGSNQTAFTSTLSWNVNQWMFMACSINENGGATGGIWRCNGTSETFNPNYSGPSASAAASTLQVTAKGGGFGTSQNGSRIAMMAMFEGAVISDANLAAIFDLTRGRFGI